MILCLAAALPAFAQIRYDNYIYEDRSFLENLDDVRRVKASPFEDVPPDHWAYRAVLDLVQSGLLRGYEGELFRGDQVVTRYELAMIVSRMLDNYLSWHQTGRMPVREYTTGAANQPAGLPRTGPPLNAIAPPDAVISPTRRVSVDLPSLGRMGISRTQPKDMGVESEQSDLEKFKAEILTEVRKVVAESMDDRFSLTTKQIDELEKLVNEFKKELKDMNKNLDKQIKETNKIALRNEREIQKLKDENKRFNVTGSERFFLYSEDVVTGDGCYEGSDGGRYERCNMRVADMYNVLQLNFTSQPEPASDLTIGGSLIAGTRLGGMRGMNGDRTKAPSIEASGAAMYEYWRQQLSSAYRRNIEGSGTALTVNDLYVRYQDTTENYDNPRNFKMSSLSAGNISVLFSPFTVMGKPLQGITASMKLNDYNFTVFGAREKLHQKEPFFIPDYEDKNNFNYNTTYFSQDQYDRYRYGASIETSLFGNQSSRVNFTRTMMFDNKDTNFPGCSVGNWVDLTFAYDAFEYKSPDSDISTTDMFCLPPVKNSVSSVFAIYPLMPGLTLMGEYAHSTYFKEGYKVLSPFNTFTSCNTNDASKENVCWWDSKERNEQDDGFLVILNYNKGPLTIFPMGYVYLGPEFFADIDISAFAPSDSGFDIGSVSSILPISLQSMKGLVFRPVYKISPISEASALYLNLKEIEPIYFDLGALASGFSTLSSKVTAMGPLNNALSRINNRTGKISIDVLNMGYKHYLTDKITFNAGYTKANLAIPPHCVDANFIEVKDDSGNILDKVVGNGIADCAIEAGDDQLLALKADIGSQTYGLEWQTSKRGFFKTNYTISNIAFDLQFRDPTATARNPAEQIIFDLVPQGKYFELYNEFRYKLTGSSTLKMMYQQTYDRLPESSDMDINDTTGKISQDKFPTIDRNKFLLVLESSF